MKFREIFSSVRKQIQTRDHWSVYVILFFILMFYGFTRLWMWLEYGMAGFGYDTGIYRHIINGYFLNPGDIPFGFSAYSNWLMILGESVDSILFGWYILLSILVIYIVYRVARVYFDRVVVGVFSVLLYTMSIVQYEFFWWYYYRQFLSLFFILIAFLLIHYRSYLVIFVLVAIGIIHPLSLIPLGLSMMIYLFFVDRDTRLFIFLSGFISVCCLLILNWKELMIYMMDFLQYKGVAENFVKAGYQEFTGQFIGWSEWLNYAVWYIPFGIWGVLKYVKKQKLLIIFFLVNILLIVLQIVFYRRFFVFLDVMVIIFAAVCLADIWTYVRGKSYRFVVYSLVILYSIVGLTRITDFILDKDPLIYPVELSGIEQIPTLVTDSEYIISINSMYAPWLRGYADKKVIAPGLFEYNRWNQQQWNDFWFSPNMDMKVDMLREYEISPIYIYTGGTYFHMGSYSTHLMPFLIRVDL